MSTEWWLTMVSGNEEVMMGSTAYVEMQFVPKRMFSACKNDLHRKGCVFLELPKFERIMRITL